MRPRENRPDSQVIGFNASGGRIKGTADGTCIVAIRVEDRAVDVVAHWLPPEGATRCEPPRDDVRAVLDYLLENENTVAFKSDGYGWRDELAELENRYHDALWAPHLVIPTAHQARAFEEMLTAIDAGKLAIDLDAHPALGDHLLNLRVRQGARTPGKAHDGPHAPKVDLAQALSYAYAALLDARANAPRRRTGNAWFV
jgi:hypothetical protein